jgi:uncharacterized protein (DUF2141 family)
MRCTVFILATALLGPGIGAAAAQDAKGHALSVTVTGAAEDKGLVRAALFDDPGAFPDGKERASAQAKVVNGKAQLTFEGLSGGSYAISLYHDANGNDEFDQAVFGIPEESYGFSRIDHGVMSKPAFEDARFEVEDDTDLTIQLQGP